MVWIGERTHTGGIALPWQQWRCRWFGQIGEAPWGRHISDMRPKLDGMYRFGWTDRASSDFDRSVVNICRLFKIWNVEVWSDGGNSVLVHRVMDLILTVESLMWGRNQIVRALNRGPWLHIRGTRMRTGSPRARFNFDRLIGIHRFLGTLALWDA